MKRIQKIAFTGLSLTVLMCADFSPQSTQVFGFMPEASAIIGRPATPVSYAGVARRHTAVVAPVATAAVVAPVATAAVIATPVVAPVATTIAVGTVVVVLPTGCATTKIVNGANYYYCGNVYYRPTYQSNNLVYVVVVP